MKAFRFAYQFMYHGSNEPVAIMNPITFLKNKPSMFSKMFGIKEKAQTPSAEIVFPRNTSREGEMRQRIFHPLERGMSWIKY